MFLAIFGFFRPMEKMASDGPKWGQDDFFLLIQTLPTFWAERIWILRFFIFGIFLGSQISGLGPAWAHPRGPRVGPPTWTPRGPTHLGPSGGPLGWALGWARVGPRVGPRVLHHIHVAIRPHRPKNRNRHVLCTRSPPILESLLRTKNDHRMNCMNLKSRKS